MLLNPSFCCMQTWCMVGFGQNSTLPPQWALYSPKSFEPCTTYMWGLRACGYCESRIMIEESYHLHVAINEGLQDNFDQLRNKLFLTDFLKRYIMQMSYIPIVII